MMSPGLEQVAAALRQKTGLKLDPVIGPDLAGAAQRASARLGVDSLMTLAQMLSADPRLDDEFIAELTIGETYFFRDQPHFDFVANAVVPARRRSDTFRIWSAGCSTGEEAWSLAMLCRTLGLLAFDVLGTDLSVKSLSRAVAGAYPAWSVDRCPNPVASSWLHFENGLHHVDEALRPNVRFEYLNLASDKYPRVATGTSGLDLIFCRNVLIYLDPITVARVYQNLFGALAMGGWLLCGPSDPLPPAHVGFTRFDTGMGSAYLRGAPAARAPAPRPVAQLALPPRPAIAQPIVPAVAPKPADPTPATVVLEAAALSNQGLHAQAQERVSLALHRHPESVELRFLAASLLLAAGELQSAADELKRVLYLDPSLAMAHFTLGLTLHRLGRKHDAARAYRNAERLAAALPPDEIVPSSDGQAAGRLAHSSRGQLNLLERGLDD